MSDTVNHVTEVKHERARPSNGLMTHMCVVLFVRVCLFLHPAIAIPMSKPSSLFIVNTFCRSPYFSSHSYSGHTHTCVFWCFLSLWYAHSFFAIQQPYSGHLTQPTRNVRQQQKMQVLCRMLCRMWTLGCTHTYTQNKCAATNNDGQSYHAVCLSHNHAV